MPWPWATTTSTRVTASTCSRGRAPRQPFPILPCDRKLSCTHVKVTRIWGSYHCWHCGKYPQCGWVWRCCADWTPSKQPKKPSCPELNPESGTDLDILKPWMQDLVERGEYTAEQVQILAGQRREAIRAMKEREKNDHARVTPHSGPPHNSPLGIFRAQLMDMIMQMDESTRSAALAPKACAYQTCSRCRPGFVDRGWISVETAYSPSPQDLDMFDMEQAFRPVSEINVCRQLGLSHRKRLGPQCCSIMERSGCTPGNQSTGKEIRRRTGRASLRGDENKQPITEECSDTTTHKDAIPISSNACVGERLLPRPMLLPAIEFNGAEDRRRNSDTATQSDNNLVTGMRIDDTGAVKVSNGIAVTEEAVDTKMADIITQF